MYDDLCTTSTQGTPDEKHASVYLQKLLNSGWTQVKESEVQKHYVQSKWICGVLVVNTSMTPILIVGKDGDKRIVSPYYDKARNVVDIYKPIGEASGSFWKEKFGISHNPAYPKYNTCVTWLKKTIPVHSIKLSVNKNNFYLCNDQGLPSMIIATDTSEENFNTLTYPEKGMDIDTIVKHCGTELNALFKNRLPKIVVNDPCSKLKNIDVYFALDTFILPVEVVCNIGQIESITLVGVGHCGAVKILFKAEDTDVLERLYNERHEAILVQSDIDVPPREIHMSGSVVALEQVIEDNRRALNTADVVTEELQKIKMENDELVGEKEKLNDQYVKVKIENRSMKDKLSVEAEKEAKAKREYERRSREETLKGEKIKHKTSIMGMIKTIVGAILTLASSILLWKVKYGK